MLACFFLLHTVPTTSKLASSHPPCLNPRPVPPLPSGCPAKKVRAFSLMLPLPDMGRGRVSNHHNDACAHAKPTQEGRIFRCWRGPWTSTATSHTELCFSCSNVQVADGFIVCECVRVCKEKESARVCHLGATADRVVLSFLSTHAQLRPWPPGARRAVAWASESRLSMPRQI